MNDVGTLLTVVIKINYKHGLGLPVGPRNLQCSTLGL